MDVTQVEAFLADRSGGEAGDVTPLGAGVWSSAFAFRRLDQDYVIRFGAHGDDTELTKRSPWP
jgi:hygromycin-B 4-O-kinase